jgi:O-antigen/teichoic acid export membrane protein
MTKFNFFKLLMTRGISSFGTLALTYLISTYYGIEELGVYSIVIGYVGLLAIISRLGLDVVTLKVSSILYQKKEKANFYSFIKYTYSLVGLISIILMVFCYYFYEELAVFLGIEVHKYLFIYLLYFLPMTYLALHCSIFKAMKLAWLYPLFELGSASFLLAIVIFITASVNSLINLNLLFHIHGVFFLILFAIGSGIIYKACTINFNTVNITSQPINKKNFIKSIPDFFILSVFAYMANTGIPIIVADMVTKENLGIFMVCFRLAILVNFLITIVNATTSPNLALHSFNYDLLQLKKCIVKANKTLMISCLPVLLILFIFAKYILEIFGLGSELSITVLRILIFGQLINVLTGVVSSILNMAGGQKENRNITILSSILCVFLILLLTPNFGILGVATSLSIYWLFKNTLSAIVVNKKLKINVLRYR